MFGAEGDRISAMRAQQQQQYAEDLRRQIEEKQNKSMRQRQTPPSYSTTQNESMQNTINSINFNNNKNNSNTTATNSNSNNNSNPNNFTVRPPNISRQNQAPHRNNYMNSPSKPNNDLSNFENNNNYGSRENLYSIPTTSTIAPLTLNVPQPTSLMTTSYIISPPSSLSRGGLNADKTTFPRRIESIESNLFNLREELNFHSSKVNELNETVFPQIFREISDLRNKIECESSQAIPHVIQPVRNSIKEQRNMVENNNQNQREIHSNLFSSISELNTKINSFSPVFSDLQENSKSSFITLRTDINRNRNMLETSLSRLAKIEGIDASISSKIVGQNDEFNQTDKAISIGFDGFQTNTNDLMASISSQIAYEIQLESQKREAVSSKLLAQVSEVNDRSKSAISRLSQNVAQLDFKDSLDEIAKQLSSALNASSNDTDVKVIDLTRKLDAFLADCEDNFGSVQSETVATIEAIKANHMGSMEAIESALESEHRIRNKNSAEIASKYAQFRELIQQEENLQMENCNQSFNELTFSMKSAVNDVLTPIFTDVHGALCFIGQIEETEAKLDKIERALNSTNNNLMEKMAAVQNQFKSILTKINNERNDAFAAFDNIERKIEQLEGDKKKLAVLKRTEIHAIQKVIETGLDAKVSSVEDELSQIMKQMAEIQLDGTGSGTENEGQNSSRNGSRKGKRNLKSPTSKTDGRTEGAILLESLVNETNSKKAKTCIVDKNNNDSEESTNSSNESNNAAIYTNSSNNSNENNTNESYSNESNTNENNTNESYSNENNTNESDSNENNTNESENSSTNNYNAGGTSSLGANDDNTNGNEDEEDAENSGKVALFGEPDNSLFLTTNKTMEITTENDNASSDANSGGNEDYSKIGSNKLLETTQRFHFVPPPDVNNAKEDDGAAKASTVKFNLNMEELESQHNQLQQQQQQPNSGRTKKSLSMPKLSLIKQKTEPKFKVDTSFSSNSIKQGNLPNSNNGSSIISEGSSLNSSSSNQIDDSPLSAVEVKLPFARTNEIEQVLKPEALATLQPHSMSQIIESTSILMSDDADADDGEAENKNEISDLVQPPSELNQDGGNLEEFKFNPDDFKIDLGVGKEKQENKNEMYKKTGDNIGKVTFGNLKASDAIVEEEEEDIEKDNDNENENETEEEEEDTEIEEEEEETEEDSSKE